MQYARAIYEALALGPYLNLLILMPCSGELEQDCGHGRHLSELAADEVEGGVEGLEEGDEERAFDVWDSWHRIRTICNYSHKLSVGMYRSPLLELWCAGVHGRDDVCIGYRLEISELTMACSLRSSSSTTITSAPISLAFRTHPYTLLPTNDFPP